MVDVKKFHAVGEEIEIKGEKIRIVPLSVSEQARFASLQEEGKTAEASEFVFITTLKKADPTLSEDDIRQINDTEFIKKFTEAVFHVNGWQKPNFQQQDTQQTQEKQ